MFILKKRRAGRCLPVAVIFDECGTRIVVHEKAHVRRAFILWANRGPVEYHFYIPRKTKDTWATIRRLIARMQELESNKAKEAVQPWQRGQSAAL